MITLALAQMMYFVALRVTMTGGEDGIQAVPRGRLFGVFDLANEMTMYVFVVVVVLAAFLLIYRIINSPFGEVLKAIRENELRAISLGYKTDRYKLVAFMLSAALAGARRVAQGAGVSVASLTDVHWNMSGEVVLMTLVGGLGTVFGPVVGAFLIVAMENYFSAVRPMGAGDPGRDFRGLRAGIPARHRRRIGATRCASSCKRDAGFRDPASRGELHECGSAFEGTWHRAAVGAEAGRQLSAVSAGRKRAVSLRAGSARRERQAAHRQGRRRDQHRGGLPARALSSALAFWRPRAMRSARSTASTTSSSFSAWSTRRRTSTTRRR